MLNFPNPEEVIIIYAQPISSSRNEKLFRISIYPLALIVAFFLRPLNYIQHHIMNAFWNLVVFFGQSSLLVSFKINKDIFLCHLGSCKLLIHH